MKNIFQYLVHLPYRIYLTTWVFIALVFDKEIPYWLEQYVKEEREQENIYPEDFTPVPYRR